MDRADKLVVKPQFNDASSFYEGFAEVQVGQKFGFIDTTGNLVIKPQFDDVERFLEGLAAVQVGKKWGFINSKGKLVVKPQFDDIYYFSDGLALVTIGHKWGFINNTGQLVIKPQFDGAWSFLIEIIQTPTSEQIKAGNRRFKLQKNHPLDSLYLSQTRINYWRWKPRITTIKSHISI
nr:WG repeat-containing protein [Dulcicalothrix desertica]